MNRTEETQHQNFAYEQNFPEMDNEHINRSIKACTWQIQAWFSWKQTMVRESSRKANDHKTLFSDF